MHLIFISIIMLYVILHTKLGIEVNLERIRVRRAILLVTDDLALTRIAFELNIRIWYNHKKKSSIVFIEGKVNKFLIN